MPPPKLTLQALSLAAISKHIWQQWDLSTPLAEVSHASAVKDFDEKIPAEVLVTYDRHRAAAYEAIMTIKGLPEIEKAQVACSFKKLEKNMLQWAKDIVQVLNKPKVKNTIVYCLAKTAIRTNLTVDREKTMFNVLFDSYGRVKLTTFGCGNICVLSVYNLYRFIEFGTYRKHDWLSKKIRRELKFYKPMEHWFIRMRLMSCFRNFKFSKMELLMSAVIEAKFEVFCYLLHKLSDRYYTLLPARIYSLLLFQALSSDGDKEAEYSTVMYLLDKLQECDEKSWMTVFTHWFMDIILWNFHSSDPEYSVVYYQLGCEVVSVDLCAGTLSRLLNDLINEPLDKCGYTAWYIKRRAVLLEIWRRTPVKVKQMMIDFFEKDFLQVYHDKDYILLSTLLTDSAFSTDQCAFLIFITVVKMRENVQDVEAFLSHLPERHRSVPNKFSKEELKRYIANHTYLKGAGTDISFVFRTEAEFDNFKEELFQDKQYVADVLSGIGENMSEEHASMFLNWVLKDEESTNKFLREKIIDEQWMVDIMKKYLLRDTGCKESCLLDYFVKDAEERLKFKKIIRSDVPFVLDILDKVLHRCLSEIAGVLDCLFDPNEKEEQKTLVEKYLLSEKGRQAICSLATKGEDVKHVDLYTKHNLKSTLNSMRIFKELWLEPFQLTHMVVEILLATKIESKAPTLFPHQGEDDGEIIVIRNRIAFLSILNQEIELDDLIASLTEVPRVRAFVRYSNLDDDLGL